jgi:hypothetical protein
MARNILMRTMHERKAIEEGLSHTSTGDETLWLLIVGQVSECFKLWTLRVILG